MPSNFSRILIASETESFQRVIKGARSAYFTSLLIAVLALCTASCTFVFQKGRRTDIEKISQLKSELSELERAKQELDDRLKNEIADKEVKVEMMAKGLVITFVSEVLFDSGKDKLKEEASEKLNKIASVLNTTVKDLNIGIEGHTDDQPIKYSGWKSNWELSTARALSVLHYLLDTNGVVPERVSASGFGEYRPVASNETKEGRQKNRRVEIVILPKAEKVAADQAQP